MTNILLMNIPSGPLPTDYPPVDISRVIEEGYRPILQLQFINEKGHVLFTSNYNLDSPWRDKAYPSGNYRTLCNIPGDFLNEGMVNVTCWIANTGLHDCVHVMERDVVRFKVTDRMDPDGVRGSFSFPWPSGGIRPRLPWKVEKTA